jgi:ABC-2 type transport system ATP-binding protein
MTSIIEIKDLHKKFGKFEALRGLSLTAEKGEILGFVGPNGAGKSTTIRTILGELHATSGEVKVFGLDAFRDAVEIHKRLAYVPGEVNLWKNLSGGEVVDFFLKLSHNYDKARVEDLYKKFDFDPKKKVKSYSKGSRQKIALIAALARDVDLYVFDEPTSGLDPLMERVFQDEVFALKNQGKTIFLSSHILSEVEHLCDRVAIIREGEIIEAGTLDELRGIMNPLVTIATNQQPVGDIPGATDVKYDGDKVTFSISTADYSKAIDFLNGFGIKKVETALPSLEDLFIHHYDAKGE